MRTHNSSPTSLKTTATLLASGRRCSEVLTPRRSFKMCIHYVIFKTRRSYSSSAREREPEVRGRGGPSAVAPPPPPGSARARKTRATDPAFGTPSRARAIDRSRCAARLVLQSVALGRGTDHPRKAGTPPLAVGSGAIWTPGLGERAPGTAINVESTVAALTVRGVACNGSAARPPRAANGFCIMPPGRAA